MVLLLFLPIVQLLSSVWRIFLKESLLQKLYFIFLKFFNEKENKEACTICFEVKISRERKWNFWWNISVKRIRQSDNKWTTILGRLPPCPLRSDVSAPPCLFAFTNLPSSFLTFLRVQVVHWFKSQLKLWFYKQPFISINQYINHIRCLARKIILLEFIFSICRCAHYIV